MPQKPKYQKEEIVKAAYELVREKGMDAVVAREVGKQLNTSATPIFTVWTSMDELKAEVRQLAREKFLEYMNGIIERKMSFMEIGFGWVKYAYNEPNLYHMLFLTKEEEKNPFTKVKRDFAELIKKIVPEIMKEFDISEDDATDLFDKMAIFSNGLAAFVISDEDGFDEESIRRTMGQVGLGLVFTYKLKRGNFNPVIAAEMTQMSSEGIYPDGTSYDGIVNIISQK